MLKFTVKLLLLISTLLFGILLGIQQAERGIFSILGEPTEQQKNYYIKKIDNEEVEIAEINEKNKEEEVFSEKMLEEKQEKWKEFHHHNKWSNMGNKIGNTVYGLSRKGAGWFVDQLDKVL